MTNKLDTVRTLAKKKAEAEQTLAGLGMMNVPSDPEKRVQQDAVYQMTVGYRDSIATQYREAMASLTPDELRELAGMKDTP